jgi:phage I-like protein
MKLHVFRITNGAAERFKADGKLPDRIKVLNWGDNPAIEGINPKLGEHSVRMFNAIMARKGLDRVALDFEHNTVPGTVEYERSQEPRAIAAHGPAELVPGDGLYLTNLNYTPHGNDFALDYPDLSPAVHIDPATGEVDFLHSCALTRAGAVLGLSYYSIEAHIEDKVTRRDEMDWKDFVRGFAGLGADATDEQLQAGFEAKVIALAAENVGSVRESITTLSATVEGLKPGDGHEAEITALSATVASLKDELGTVSGEVVAIRRQGVCEQAAREGKVIPLSAEQIAAMDPAMLAGMVEKLPVTVPVDQRTPTNVQPLNVATASSALKVVAGKCGLDPEKVMEANKVK